VITIIISRARSLLSLNPILYNATFLTEAKKFVATALLDYARHTFFKRPSLSLEDTVCMRQKNRKCCLLKLTTVLDQSSHRLVGSNNYLEIYASEKKNTTCGSTYAVTLRLLARSHCRDGGAAQQATWTGIWEEVLILFAFSRCGELPDGF
jgi:hypothetical protein